MSHRTVIFTAAIGLLAFAAMPAPSPAQTDSKAQAEEAEEEKTPPPRRPSSAPT